LQSTKPLLSTEAADKFTVVDTTNHRTNFLYATLGVVHPATGQVYTDQTGRFPVDANDGHKYLMVLYDYDSNAILTAPLRDRRGPTIKAAYQKLHALLLEKGYRPKLQRLDNEALKEFLTDNEIDFQLTPPGIHGCNAAERAMPNGPSKRSKIISLLDSQ
jgi:hypothetical protein